MIPLGGDRFPTSLAELAEALRMGLRELIRLPDENSAIVVDPNRLRVDVTGGTLLIDRPPAEALDRGQSQPGPSFSCLEALGHPLMFQGAEIDFDVTASDVRCQFDRTSGGRPMLSLAAARDGKCAARISRRDFERIVTTQAAALAKTGGIAIERIDFDFTQLGPRSIRLKAKAHVQTKALFKMIRGAVNLSGRLDIDDRLVARLSELAVTGEGTMIALAVNLYRGRITAWEGKEIPLGQWTLGEMRLRDLQLQVGDEMQMTAAFG